MNQKTIVAVSIAGTLLVLLATARAQEPVKFPLALAWVSREVQPPLPAFRNSVIRKRDGKQPSLADRRKLIIYHRQGLAEPATYDYAPEPVVAGGRVYVGSSSDEALFCLDAGTGKSRWTRWLPGKSDSRHAGLGYGKNSLSARPILVGDRFYLRASLDARGTVGLVYGFNLWTGEPVVEGVNTGTQDAGCSVAIGSTSALYFRDYRHTAFELASGNSFELTATTRPSCWPSTLPVGGILFAPEGGAGCSCGVSYQLSFALAPAADALPAKPKSRKGK